jgi:carboxyl-terminal processing protease
MTIRRTLIVLLSFGFCLSSPFAVQAQDDTSAKVEQLLGRLDAGRADQIWPGVSELERLGPSAVAAISKGLERGASARLGTAKALLVMDGGDVYRAACLRVLKSLVTSKESREIRVMAADLLNAHGGKSDLRSMRSKVKTIDDAHVKIAVLKGLRSWGRRELKKFLSSDDGSLRAESALALASMGNIDAAKGVLSRLKFEPTDRGRQARLYLDQEHMLERLSSTGGLEKKDELLKFHKATILRLETQLKKAQSDAKKQTSRKVGDNRPAQFGHALGLLEEILQKVQAYYVNEDKVKEKDLANLAAKGLMESLDPFSSYMTEEETKKFKESIRQRYAGIGAVVQTDPRTGFLTIVRPIYGGPAFRAGLRTLDQVIEVEGLSTKGKTVQDLVTVLKGKIGTEVAIKVKRFLNPKAELENLSIVRRSISLPSVSYDLLPGNVGYLQLSQFGYDAVAEVTAALNDLERRGMIGLILDLRGNPGGLLTAAVEIAELFLPKDKLIVYQQGRKGTRVGRRKEFRSRKNSPYPNFPMVVMIDESSASASEIVSGTLKVHKRAQIVGQRSFGKGSVQQLYNIRKTKGESMLRLTIAYYYLPDGNCIHRKRAPRAWRFREALNLEIRRWQRDGLISIKQAEQLLDKYKATPGGVAPDIYVKRDAFTKEVQLKLGELERMMIIEKYIQKNYLKHQKLFHKLAFFDGEITEPYPEFEALMLEVKKTGLTKEQVRVYLRQTVRRFVQDDLGRNFPSDFQGDRQLERGIYQIMSKLGLKAGDVREYRPLAKRCKKKIAEEKEAKEKNSKDF